MKEREKDMTTNDLTPAEIWLLNVVCELGQGDIYAIMDHISHEKDWKYTTIQTMIHHLCDKNFIERKKVGRRFIYRPIHSRSHIFETVLNKLFGNSLKHDPAPLIDYLLNVKNISGRDEQILKTLLKEEDKGSKEKSSKS